MRDTADLVLLTGAADETGAGEAVDAAQPAPSDPVRSANVAPTDQPRVLVKTAEGLKLRRHVWGLIPPWSNDASGAARMINARVETVTTKPAFRRAIRTARCLFPADGWYEWAVGPSGRQPHLVRRADGEVLWLAGLWACWHPPTGGPPISSAAVLTGPAPQQLTWLHERAPMVVPESLASRWLTVDDTDPQPLLDTVAGAGYPPLQWHPVSRELGQVRTKDARLMLPVNAAPEAITLF